MGRLVFDSVKELETVPVRSRPVDARAAKMAFDFEIEGEFEGEDDSITGVAGEYVIVVDGRVVAVLDENQFRAQYAKVVNRKAAPAATGA